MSNWYNLISLHVVQSANDYTHLPEFVLLCASCNINPFHFMYIAFRPFGIFPFTLNAPDISETWSTASSMNTLTWQAHLRLGVIDTNI